MKFDITFSCGHTEQKELFGKMKDRMRTVEYFEKECVCSECYKKQQEEQNRKMQEKYNLPYLEGSEKQIAWAEKIIMKDIEKIEVVTDKEIKENFVALLEEKTNAKWWIDTRNESLKKKIRRSLAEKDLLSVELVGLEGSEKQISWAEKIRSKFLVDFAMDMRGVDSRKKAA